MFENIKFLSKKLNNQLLKIMKRRKEVILPVFAVIWNKTDAFSFKVSV